MRTFFLTLIFFVSFDLQAICLQRASSCRTDAFDSGQKLITPDPIFCFNDDNGNSKWENSEEWKYETDSLKLFHDNASGAYYNVCKGLWEGLGTPEPACISYCKSAVNLIEENAAHVGQTDPSAEGVKTACSVPEREKLPQVIIKKIIGSGMSTTCRRCLERDYEVIINTKLKACLTAYDDFLKKVGGSKSEKYFGEPVNQGTSQ